MLDDFKDGSSATAEKEERNHDRKRPILEGFGSKPSPWSRHIDVYTGGTFVPDTDQNPRAGRTRDMTRIADLSFGLDRYALPLLSILSASEPDFAAFDEVAQRYDVRLQTHLLFAGDRRWAALVLYPQLAAGGLRTVVTFGRDTHEDAIVVETWGPLAGFAVGEAPTVEDTPPQVTRWRVAPEHLMQAAEYIRKELARSYGAMRASRDLTTSLGTER